MGDKATGRVTQAERIAPTWEEELKGIKVTPKKKPKKESDSK